ncbi:hypothetical protein BCS42_12230 [Crenothrix sp. D3]|nr:hypothetical protein BCS42_12230 [Crenothrix sp. D3]
MNKFVVIIGMGELGEIFARGFLKLGYPVYPVLRSMQLATVVSAIPEPELVLLAIGEDDFHPQLEVLPDYLSSDRDYKSIEVVQSSA